MFRLLALRSVIFPFLRLVWRLLRDRRVSVFTKIIPLLALIYLLSPYDKGRTDKDASGRVLLRQLLLAATNGDADLSLIVQWSRDLQRRGLITTEERMSLLIEASQSDPDTREKPAPRGLGRH